MIDLCIDSIQRNGWETAIVGFRWMREHHRTRSPHAPDSTCEWMQTVHAGVHAETAREEALGRLCDRTASELFRCIQLYQLIMAKHK